MLRGRFGSLLVFLGSLAAMAGCIGCGNGGSAPTQPAGPTAVIFVSPPPTSLAVKASATLDASAIYASSVGNGSTAVTWTVSCGTAGACGTFSANDDGAAITYTAPTAIPSGSKVTVTATSVADTTKSISSTITIVAPIPISVSFYAPVPASQQVNSSFLMSASIANDVTANPLVRWTVTCGSPQCGSFSSATTSDEQTTMYTSPATIPTNGSVTITITSVTDPTKSASATILITAAAGTLADGRYIFQLSGGSAGQASFTTGAFVAKSGVISGGEQDSIYYQSDADNNFYGYASTAQITGGSYGTTADGNTQVTLQLGSYASETLSGAIAGNGKGFVSNLNGASVNGTLDLQTSTAVPAGGYVLTLSGGDQYTDSIWIGGVLNVDGASNISGNGSILDVVGGQSLYTGTQTLGASPLSAPDANGRFQFQLTNGPSSTLPTIYMVGYIIDATHIRLIETGDQQDSTNFQGVLGGIALGQGANTGRFSTASVAGSSYVFGGVGDDTQGPLQLAGVLTLNSDGSVAGTLNWNDLTGSGAQAPAAVTGTYTIDPTGRATISKATDGSGFSYSFHLYLTGDGNGLLLSNDTNDLFLGQAFQRQTGPFSSTSLSGAYGLNAEYFTGNSPQPGLSPGEASGPVIASGNGDTTTIAGFADSGAVNADFAVNGTFSSDANGIFQGSMAGFNPNARTKAGSFTLYLIDNNEGILIETDNAQLVLGRIANIQ